ncbi:MAG: FAD:protein FMN transferase, partial [Solirubrobacteraceae bacterium]
MRSTATEGSVGRFEFPLWGGLAVVAVTDERRLHTAVDAVRQVTAAYDEACSSFRTDSELSQLNQAAGRPVVVSELLFRALREAIGCARETDGAVDPTVGRALVAHGINPPLGMGAGGGMGAGRDMG